MKAFKILIFTIPGLIVGVLIMFYIAGTPSESESKIIAGNMSKSSICTTTGYIIRKNKGKNFDVYSEPCKVRKFKSGKIRIESAYISPIKNTKLRYYAIGSVIGNELTLEKIKVLGIDNDYIPFSEF